MTFGDRLASQLARHRRPVSHETLAMSHGRVVAPLSQAGSKRIDRRSHKGFEFFAYNF